MKQTILTFLFVVGFALAGCTQTTETTFYWTATGDDSSSGTASSYEMMYATDTNSLILELGTNITGLPTPSIAGTAETFTGTLSLQSETRYFFALRAVDNNNNWSNWSNITYRDIPDIIPPMMIIDFRIQP